MKYSEKPSLKDVKSNIIFSEKPSLKDIEHIGVKRRSGRYPWGSGENPFQHEGDFVSRVKQLRQEGFTYTDEDGKTWTGDTAIAKSLNLTTSEFRTALSVANSEIRSQQVAQARKLRDSGMSLQAIAKEMGFKNDSSVRALLDEDAERRMNQARNAAEFLKEQVKEKGMIDIGAGAEKAQGLNISAEKMKEARYILEAEGYEIYGVGVPQATNPGKQTIMTVLCPPGTEYKDVYANRDKVASIEDYISNDDGQTFHKAFEYPASMDSKRLQVVYGDEGGSSKDGWIDIRRGCKDLDLGDSNYAQVRILVDGTHYLKGMAGYADDLPDGIDVRFNTGKKSGIPVMSDDPDAKQILKPIKNDPENPFGSSIKEHGGQSYYDDPNGKYIDSETGNHQSLSLINKTRIEGDVYDWKDHLPSQFLAKQPMELINHQLDLSKSNKQAEYDEICDLNNPTIKRKMLNDFASDCDSQAVHLEAAALPRQKYENLIPVPQLKDDECYCPNYRNGEQVALIRFPHGGTFEIPIVTVNNKNEDGKRIVGNALDGIGINSNVANRLSGADFDGDTVMVIPVNDRVKINSTPPLDGLKDFDPKVDYGGKEPGTFKVMTKQQTQKEMGVISNLITDMTLQGATNSELERAVKHSMVVIDAHKHKLDYKQSEIDNDIAGLKRRYQSHTDENGETHEGGASTLISRAKSPEVVLKRVGTPHVDPETGKLIYKEVREEYTDKKGKTQVRTQQSTKMAETDNAMDLISDNHTQQEVAYGNYANYLKSLANQARKEALNTGRLKYSASAKETYAEEVKSLDSKLALAEKNAPRERQAQLMANSVVAAKKADNPAMTKDEVKKASQQALAQARVQVNAKRHPIDITDKEWEAIQAGAISDTKLSKMLKYTDTDALKQRATPRASKNTTISTAKQNQIKSMAASGYTIADIADRLGVSRSTVSKYIKPTE